MIHWLEERHGEWAAALGGGWVASVLLDPSGKYRLSVACAAIRVDFGPHDYRDAVDALAERFVGTNVMQTLRRIIAEGA